MINFGRYSIRFEDHGIYHVEGHPLIKSILIFPNSNIAVLGHDDQQIPECQGPLVEILECYAKKEGRNEQTR